MVAFIILTILIKRFTPDRYYISDKVKIHFSLSDDESRLFITRL